MKRIGLGKGKGKGYKNIIPIRDKRVHIDSGRGIKQPQKIINLDGIAYSNPNIPNMTTATRQTFMWVESTLVNDEISTDEEMYDYFTKNGINQSEAKFYISQRDEALLNPLGFKLKIKEEKPLKKVERNRLIGSISYQFGKIKSTEKSKELFNKNLDELSRVEFDKLFDYMRNKG